MLKKLSEFKIGETGLVKKVEGEGRFRRRLLDMGVTPSTFFTRPVSPILNSDNFLSIIPTSLCTG